MVGVEVGSKAPGKPSILVESPLSPCLSCLPSSALPSLIQTSGSPKEFLEVAVSEVVGAGGGWVLESGVREVGGGVG